MRAHERAARDGRPARPRRAAAGAEETDVPGAFRVERVDEALVAAGGSGRRAAARSSPGLCVGSQDGERVLDLCAAPGGKTAQLRGEVTAVEIDPHRARELRENLATMGATTSRSSRRTATALPPELDGFDRALVDAPCSGLGVLAQRPDLRWRAQPLPELQLALLRSAAERVRPGGTIVYSVCTLNPDECEAVVDASGLRVLPLGEEWPQFAHPSRPEFLLTLPHVHGTSGFFVARLPRTIARHELAWSWMRTVEIEPSLYAADFARLGEQIDDAPARRLPHLPLRRRRRPLRRADHDRARRARVDRAARARRRRRARLPPDGRQPAAPLPADRARGRRQRHLPLRGRRRRARRRSPPRASTASRSASRSTPRREPEDVAAVAGDADLVLCMSIHPGYCGQEFMPEALERHRAAARGAARARPRPGRRRDRRRERRAPSTTRARRCSSPARRSSAREDLPRAYRGLVQDLA